MLVASIGGLAGVVLAIAGLHFILPFAADSIPRIGQVAIDLPVLGFSLLIAVITTLLFSLAPALQVAKFELIGSLKEGSRGIARGHDRLRGALVVGQITLGLTLVSAAGLLIASFLYLQRRDLGFRPDHLLTFSVSLPEEQYGDAKQIQFFSRLVDRLNALPGVRSAAVGGPLPMTGRNFTVSFNIQERPVPERNRPTCALTIVSPGYFSTMGIPLLKGRDLTDRDDASAPPVLLVNQAFANEYFPGEEVIGKRFEPGASTSTGGSSMHEIIGVVGDAAQSPLEQRREPIYYMPHKQLPWNVVAVVLRTSVAPLALESAVRAEVAALDKQVPVYEVRAMDDWVSTAIATPRFQTLLLTSFAGIALLLTVIGLYGVMAYSVTKRRREFGVRIALGAGRSAILTMVLKQAAVLVSAGLAIGIAGALSGGLLLQNMLYGVTPRDPILLAIACLALTATGILAAYLPARRAASVDPMHALRSE
jgi:putative ABC transport system permease protein